MRIWLLLSRPVMGFDMMRHNCNIVAKMFCKWHLIKLNEGHIQPNAINDKSQNVILS